MNYFTAQSLIVDWYVWVLMAMFLILHLAYAFGQPAHYRLRHQRPAERRSGSGRPPTPGESAQGI